MENNFKVTEIDCTGTSLICRLPGATNEKIKQLFGKLPSGTGRKIKYSNQITLSHKSTPIQMPTNFFGTGGAGIYTLYTSFGEWRIGGFEMDANIEELKKLILG